MGLYKEIIQPNGVPTNYHRIALVSIDVNNQCTILVHSYVNEDGRNVEKEYKEGILEDPQFPYVYDQYLNCNYDETMNVLKAYEYLKSLPEFEGSLDV